MNRLARWAAGLACVLMTSVSLAQYDPSNPFQEKRPVQPVPEKPAEPKPDRPRSEAPKPDKPDDRCGTPEPKPAERIITIDGRVIVVSVELTRDMMPGPGKPRDGGGMVASVRLSTANEKGLPDNIKSVRLWLSNEKRESWRPRLTPVRTFRYDSKESRLVARRGPKWGAGSKATATVLLVHGSMTYRLTMPVTVEGAY